MATIRKRGKNYHVQIRNRRLTAPLTRTFSSRRAAENWARETEQALIDGHYRDPRQLAGVRIADLIQRFITEITPYRSPSGRQAEQLRLNAMAERLGDVELPELDASWWVDHFTARLTDDGVAPATVVKEIQLLKTIWDTALTDWQMRLPPNPLPLARAAMTRRRLLAGHDRMRESYIGDDLTQQIRQSARDSRSLVAYALLLALETGMRRSEIVAMDLANIDWAKRIYCIGRQKADWRRGDGDARLGRVVPLSRRARAVLRLVCIKRGLDRRTSGRIWPWKRADSLTQAVSRLMAKLGHEGVRLHDARHTFASREADHGADIRLVSRALGQRDHRTMARYTHPDMSRYADALSERGSSGKRR